jgi:hypothetical protein
MINGLCIAGVRAGLDKRGIARQGWACAILGGCAGERAVNVYVLAVAADPVNGSHDNVFVPSDCRQLGGGVLDALRRYS